MNARLSLAQIIELLINKSKTAKNAQAASNQSQKLHEIEVQLESYLAELKKLKHWIDFIDLEKTSNSWRSSINLDQIGTTLKKLKSHYANGDYDYLIVGPEFDVNKRNFQTATDTARTTCETEWMIIRDAAVSKTDLDFQIPEAVLPFLPGRPKLSAGFLNTRSLLVRFRNSSLSNLWDESDETIEGMKSTFIGHKNRVEDYDEQIKPIKRTFESLEPIVKEFLTRVTGTNGASLKEVFDPIVQTWLNQDSKLLAQFTVRPQAS